MHENGHKYNFLINQDDKAYLCPSTSTRMDDARNKRIFQTDDDECSRKLPKYDFPACMLNVTPASHRVMTKKVCEINGKEEIK